MHLGEEIDGAEKDESEVGFSDMMGLEGILVLNNPVREVHSDSLVSQEIKAFVSCIGLQQVPEITTNTHLFFCLIAQMGVRKHHQNPIFLFSDYSVNELVCVRFRLWKKKKDMCQCMRYVTCNFFFGSMKYSRWIFVPLQFIIEILMKAHLRGYWAH